MISWHNDAHPDEDPNIVWLRQQIEEIFSNHPTHNPTRPQLIPRIAALASLLAFLTFMVTMALITPPPW